MMVCSMPAHGHQGHAFGTRRCPAIDLHYFVFGHVDYLHVYRRLPPGGADNVQRSSTRLGELLFFI